MEARIKDFSDYTDSYYHTLTLEQARSLHSFQELSDRVYSIITLPIYRWIFTLLLLALYLIRSSNWLHLPISIFLTYVFILLVTQLRFSTIQTQVRKVLLPYEDKQGYRPEKSKEYEIWILLTGLLFIIHILYTVDILPVLSLYIFTLSCGICYLDIRDSYELRGIFLAFKNKIL